MKIDFRSKGFTILISIFFAVIFWAFVMADSNTTRVSDIRDVPVYFGGLDTLSQNGLVVTEKSRERGTLRIEGGVNVVGYISVNNVSAYVDLSSITEPGEYELMVNAFSNNGSVVVKSFFPAKIKVNVEKYVEKQVPVEIAYDKDIPDNYWIREATAQSDRVTVAGGHSMVQNVARATVNVSVDNLIQIYEGNPNNIYESSIPVVYVDENNDEVKGISGQSLIVSIDVLSKKTVKIDVQGAVAGQPTTGYSVEKIEQSINEIDIVGKKDVIDNINSLSVGSIDIEGASDDVISDVTIKQIDGVSLIGNNTLKISVNIKKDMEG